MRDGRERVARRPKNELTSALRWLFKPRPTPAFVLLAIILTFLGVGISKQVPVVGAVSIVTALVLLLNFIRYAQQAAGPPTAARPAPASAP